MKRKSIVQQIKTPRKIEVALKVIFSPVFYIWAIMFALVAVFAMVIEERTENRQVKQKEFNESIEELKESVKNDLSRNGTKNI